MYRLNPVIFLILTLAITISNSCVTAIEAEYDFAENLIFIDAFALNEVGLSYVSVQESFVINNNVSFRGIENANVQFENSEDATFIMLTHDADGQYRTPDDFRVSSGEKWKLFIELPDGRRYESSVESVPEPTSFENLKANFERELTFREGFRDFVPGHSLTVDLVDPSDDANYYLWKYKSYEREIICLSCNRGVLRNGECESRDLPSWATQYYDYLCDTDCWRIRFGDRLPVFSDRFSSGDRVTTRSVADIIFYRKQDILVEVQQYSINEATYDYFNTINSLVEESGGLNAPTPTGLLGNLSNPDDPEDVVLGQFAVASIFTGRIYIDRDDLPVTPIAPDHSVQLENCPTCPTNYSCDESRTRTKVKPLGWE